MNTFILKQTAIEQQSKITHSKIDDKSNDNAYKYPSSMKSLDAKNFA